MSDSEILSREPEDLIYRSCYASVELADMLATSQSRRKIRRLPVPHLYYGLFELSDSEILSLLPHVTEEQWRGVLDLALWRRDEAETGQFLHWSRFLLESEAAVARKLFRAADTQLWELSFRRFLKIVVRDEEGADPIDAQGDWIETPDGAFYLRLPDDPEAARLLQPLIACLYGLDAGLSRDLLLSALARTSIELEEDAYQARRRRIEDLGFQDYFDAISVYSPVAPEDALPAKGGANLEIASVPTLVTAESTDLLLVQALARAGRPELLEEVFFVTNKVLSADQVAPDRPDKVKIGIRKTLYGMNLGLEIWSKGRLDQAVHGIGEHHLSSFFQIGYGQLLEMQRLAVQLPLPDDRTSYRAHFLGGLCRHYPLLAVRTATRIKKRFFRTAGDVAACHRILQHWMGRAETGTSA